MSDQIQIEQAEHQETVITETISQVTPKRRPKNKELRKLTGKPALPGAYHEDPIQELRRLVKSHANWTKTQVALHHMGTDRISKQTGDTIPCLLPPQTRLDLAAARENLNTLDEQLKREMARALKQTKIWKAWLSEVPGIGEIVGAQLVGEIRIDIATKASKLKHFLGVCPSVQTGRLIRRTKGQKNSYHAGLRTALYQAWSSMWKNAARKTADAPNGKTCKYLDIWENVRGAGFNDPRYNSEKNQWTRTRPDGEPEIVKAAKAFIFKRAMWKSVDIFAEDLYAIWRTLEGLDVWPDYYAAKMGYSHGGKICVNVPKKLTLEEALQHVGDVSWRPRAAPLLGSVDDLTDVNE